MNRLISILSFIILVSCNGFAQSGANDPSFNTRDKGYNYGVGYNDTIFSIVTQNNGQVIVTGKISVFNHFPQSNIVRVNNTGTVDEFFHASTNERIYATAIQPDGKILIGGDFTEVNGAARDRIARLNTDGSLDLSFNNSLTLDSSVRAIQIQSNGKIIIGGSFNFVNSLPVSKVIRLNDDGTVDNSWNQSATINNDVLALVVQNDGKIVIGGKFTQINGATNRAIARLNIDGSIDSGFNATDITTGSNGQINALCIQNDDKIVIGGNLNIFGTEYPALRIEPSGVRDLAFGAPIVSGDVHTIHIQSDSLIVLGGSFTQSSGQLSESIVRLYPTGMMDPDFLAGLGANNTIFGLCILDDESLVIGGVFGLVDGLYRNKIARLDWTGQVDLNYLGFVGIENDIRSIAVQSDGKIILGGDLVRINDFTRNNIGRLLSDGSLDNSFHPLFNGLVYSVRVQDDDKIVIGGMFSSVDGQDRKSVARLNADGTLDTTFIPDYGLPFGVTKTVRIQNDGKILIGGTYYQTGGALTKCIIRLNPDGSLDGSFNTTVNPVSFTWSSSTINSMEIQVDQKIIISGEFSEVNGASRARIARLNADGSLDLTFNAGSGPNTTIPFDQSVAIHPSGKIFVSGHFTQFGGTLKNRIVCLNNDGSADNSFTGAAANDQVTAIAVQPDGKIIVCGTFWTYNNVVKYGVTRIHSNGVIDNAFDSGNGVIASTYNYVQSIAFQADSKILIAGSFYQYNGAGKIRIARIFNDISSFGNSLANVFTTPTSTNDCNGTVNVNVNQPGSYTYDIGGGNTLVSNEYAYFDSLCEGFYSLTVTDVNGNSSVIDFIIAVDSNYYLQNPFGQNDTLMDSLSAIVANCDIDYATVYDFYIDSYEFLGGDSVLVNWAIADINGTTIIPVVYDFSQGSGDYYVQLQVYCPNKSMQKYLVGTQGVNYDQGILILGREELQMLEFEIYPNPTNDQVHINFSGSEAELTVYDLQGKVVLKDQIQNNGIISLQNFERGVYLFDFKNSQGHSVQRVVKQ